MSAITVASLIWAILATTGLLFFFVQTKKFQGLSVSDPLTGLLNRRGLREFVEPLIREARAFKNGVERRKFAATNCVIVMFDLDRFKRLNSAYGHLGGDAALKTFATILAEHARGVDYAARWGGEEFVLALSNVDLVDAYRIAERIRLRVENTKVVLETRSGPRTVTFTVSAGMAEFSTALNLNELLERADAALYEAKEKGRNRVAVYKDPGKNARLHLA